MIVLHADDEPLHEAAQLAVAAHLYLVIDRHGRTVLTPFVEPDMQRIAVLDKQQRNAA